MLTIYHSIIIRGQYKKGKEQGPTVVLEAIVSMDLWFWHAFFGVPGSNNDINVVQVSTLLSNLLSNKSPNIKWTCNGKERDYTYFLADGIYPRWKIFAKPIQKPTTSKNKNYTKRQEAARKDVERAFGVLQARFQILQRPARVWTSQKMDLIIKACIILHNMVVADSGYNIAVEVPRHLTLDAADDVVQVDEDMELEHGGHGHIARFLASIEDKEEHLSLLNDLTEHVWTWAGNQKF